MKRFAAILPLILVATFTAPASAAVKSVSKPSAPEITSITSSPVKKGIVNLTVTVALGADNGGAPIKATKISVGKKSCTAKKTKTSCTIKGLKSGTTVTVSAKSQNKKGYGNTGASVVYTIASEATAAAPAATTTPSKSKAPSTPAKSTAPAVPVVGICDGLTVSQCNAKKSATSYLRYSSFSRTGLIKQLEFEKYSNSDAIFGVDAQGADWSAQAVKSGKSYLQYSSFSRSGLIKQLEFEGFTSEQAIYGTDSQNADWNLQAAKSGKSYLEFSSFSRAGLISQLEFEGFTTEQATYGATANGY